MMVAAAGPAEVQQLLISRPELARAFPAQVLRLSSALGFPSKTSAEITPDHPKSSEAVFGLTREDSWQTRINIALCQYWCYFHDALENGGNRFPLPAPFGRRRTFSNKRYRLTLLQQLLLQKKSSPSSGDVFELLPRKIWILVGKFPERDEQATACLNL
jgi:hypothetical protein